jgi:hypothetical protein
LPGDLLNTLTKWGYNYDTWFQAIGIKFDAEQIFKNASLHNNLDVLREVIDFITSQNSLDSRFYEAVERGYHKIVKVMLAYTDPSTYNNQAIKTAVANGRYNVVKVLLKDTRVNPGVQNQYAIGVAAKSGYPKIVAKLMKQPMVDASANGNFAIINAAKNGHNTTKMGGCALILKPMLRRLRLQLATGNAILRSGT